MLNKASFPVIIIGGAAVIWTLYRYVRSLQQRHIHFRAKGNREIHVVSNASEWEEIYPRLSQSCTVIKALGFDCEWVNVDERQPVALVQLATHDGLCVLVRIFLMKDDIPVTLRQLLSNKSIVKVGVASCDDGKKLMADYGIMVYGCVDLRYIASRVRGLRGPNVGLKGLAQSTLGVTMLKDPETRRGNWEAETLSQKQMDYAADDALVGVDIFLQLISMKIYGRNRRQKYYDSAISVDETSFGKKAQSLCQGIVDIPFKNKNLSGLLDMGNGGEDSEDAMLCEDQQYYIELPEISKDGTPGKPQRVKTSKKAFMARKRPLYYNCCLVAPDGTVLTTCDIRKAKWYIDKGLGHQIKDDPVWVQLNFEPAKRPTSDQDYYLQDKENICVVCGADEEYIRKLVIPQEYRKYFPALLKDHSSHDVLLLCIPCHLHSANFDNILRQRLALECNAPLDSGKDSRKMRDQDLLKVVSASKALMTNKTKIPESRIKELEDTVKNFYGVSSLNEDLLKKTLNIEYRIKNSNFTPHGKKVVEYYMKKEGGLLEFEKLWRKQFVETMEPKYLPALWSIEHKPERLQPLTEEMRGALVPECFV